MSYVNESNGTNGCISRPSQSKRTRLEDVNVLNPEIVSSPSSSGRNHEDSSDGVSRHMPHDVCNWTTENLVDLSLSIQYVDNCSPIELLNMFPRGLRGPLKDKLDYKHFLLDKDQLFDAVESYFAHFYPFPSFDGEFDTLCKHHVYDFLSLNAFDSKQFLAKLNNPSAELHSWFKRFEIYGTQFGKRLYHMLLKRDLICTDNASRCLLTEFDFQSLFEAFAAMFGLDSHCWAEPCLLTKKMQIKGTTFSGKADILYCWEIPHNATGTLQEHTNIVAVCQVKKQGSQTTKKTASNVSSSTQLPPHVTRDLLGQHGGELLLHYPYSLKKSNDCIFGMIIQGTEVTFTALKMTQEEYDNILKGQVGKTRPQLFLTKPYNFLKKDERKFLIRPLLELALLQDSRDFRANGDILDDKT